jgi:hypothetical protein
LEATHFAPIGSGPGGFRTLALSSLGAFTVRLVAFAVPVGLSVALTALANWALPVPDTFRQRLLWWATVLALVGVGLVVGDRLARRLLPLAAFLELSLVFPDRAPSRFRLAPRSGTGRQLGRRLEELTREGPDGTLGRVATLALGLVTALTVHDRATRGHSERVRAYAELLAAELGLPEDERDLLCCPPCCTTSGR